MKGKRKYFVNIEFKDNIFFHSPCVSDQEIFHYISLLFSIVEKRKLRFVDSSVYFLQFKALDGVFSDDIY